MIVKTSSKMRSLVVEDTLWDAMREIADATGLSISWLVRQAIADFLKSGKHNQYNILHEDKVKYNVGSTTPEE